MPFSTCDYTTLQKCPWSRGLRDLSERKTSKNALVPLSIHIPAVTTSRAVNLQRKNWVAAIVSSPLSLFGSRVRNMRRQRVPDRGTSTWTTRAQIICSALPIWIQFWLVFKTTHQPSLHLKVVFTNVTNQCTSGDNLAERNRVKDTRPSCCVISLPPCCTKVKFQGSQILLHNSSPRGS